MTRHHATPFHLSLLVFLLIPLLISGCEKQDDPMDNTMDYVATDSLTLDNKPGSVTYTSNAVPVMLTVTPTSASVDMVGDTLVFTASGGKPPYDWSVANVLIGTIQFKNGNPCVYVCKQLKSNSVWVTDRNGNVAAATIEPSTP